ncbi:HER062Cp [Eremothecium sinecaudum]|uniref:HER062Cp n=1 Tax=Eremothecium sinecaudum TaxID=45286 RepID=A0A0X8HT35_9SACH|nr:HER062Cp [Eremothecium sinecaudum]AMD21341.1 HER062Cp [Eremothecium sinecaudum]
MSVKLSWLFPKKLVSLLFSLESLDARISPPKDPRMRQKISMAAGKPRWNTLEFKLYYLLFVVIVMMILVTAYRATNPPNPNYYKFESLLSEGWLFGRKVDNSDTQYRFFRDNLFLLLVFMAAQIFIKKLVIHIFPINKGTFDLYFGIAFLFVIHGVNSLRILLHFFAMYGIAKLLKQQKNVALVLSWIYGIGTLVFNNRYRAFPFGDIIPIASFLDKSYKGVVERWDVFFNVSLLRMLSFNFDFIERWNAVHAAQTSTTPTLYEEDGSSPKVEDLKLSSIPSPGVADSVEFLDERARLIAPHKIDDYNIKNYFAYINYTPLFIAGPIITFNDYLYQTTHQLPSITPSRVFYYSLNIMCCILTMEFILHFLYVVAASKAKAWTGTPFEVSMIGFFNLNIIWLKLLIPWRIFRLWALIDGIDPPENMIRCVDNNYSTMAFWRAWHRSFNKWVLRYIYIPLGGSSNRILTSLAVFSFVAIWHDIELRLLFWGWMIVLFLLPELLATRYCAKYSKEKWFRHLCAFGAALNIWMMMIVNIFGFCLGYDGTIQFLKDLLGTFRGVLFFILATCSFFIAVQLMFEQREHEKRNGINVRC